MKCRAGDLAIVIRSEAGNLGKIVTCVRVATADDWASELTPPARGTYWLVDRPLVALFELRFADGAVAQFVRSTRLYPDANLKPIRDPGDDAVDEMVQRVGLPEGETV